MFAADKPNRFGVYANYYKQEVNELLALYEEDLINCVPHLDADHLTRLCQALYLLKTPEFENIWWRIEDAVNLQVSKLDSYHVTNILRSFSHS